MAGKEVAKKTQKAENTAQAIRAEAFRLMDIYGYEGISIQMICRNCNISVGTFYNYFASKEDLNTELMRENDQWFEEKIQSDLQTEDPCKFLYTFFDMYGEMNERIGTDFYNRTVGRRKRDPKAEANRPMHRVLEEFIWKKQQEGLIRKEKRASDIADQSFALVRGVILDWCGLNGQYNLRPEIREVVRIILNYYLTDAAKATATDM